MSWNSDESVTSDAFCIEKLLASHRLDCRNPVKTNTGFRNEVWLTDDYAVKRYGKENRSGLLKEQWSYTHTQSTHIPALIASGEDYMILERIHGTGLFRLWRDMTDRERENTVAEIAEIIREVNAVDWHSEAEIFRISDHYGRDLLTQIEKTTAALTETGGIHPELADRVMVYARQNIHVLDNAELYTVYNDLHFDNLIVTENGRINLIDYEMLNAAPRDLVLDVWQRMLIHPFTYANEDDHELTVPEDYSMILRWLKQYAPELFGHPHVRERVNLYGIAYELHLLMDYPLAEWPMERLNQYLDGLDWKL